MLKLYSNKNLAIDLESGSANRISRLTSNPDFIEPLRSKETLIVEKDCEALPRGFGLILVKSNTTISNLESDCDVVRLNQNLDYLSDGDVIRFNPGNLGISVLYRKNANTNTFLLTERCNSFCLMCSQPPRDIDDSYIVDDVLEAIPLIDKSTPEIGLSGGEPTLLGDRLFEILSALKRHLPRTAIHILSNGRTCSDEFIASKFAAVAHSDLMLGIPLYSDVSSIHDFIVQADGAFDETIRGILNLKKHKVSVELRVVLHKQSVGRLAHLAVFIARNLLFVDHVALMGLEITGFTRANLEELWIEPTEYADQLVESVRTLERARIPVSIYNHQLCLLPKEVWDVSVKSISDWKNEYIDECAKCSVVNQCGGFFSSSQYQRSEHIKAVT